MKCALLMLALLAVKTSWTQETTGFYDSRYDYLDVNTILDNRRLVKNYVDCLLNEKPCSPEGKALRRILPEGLRTKCARCTPRQKHNALVVLRRLRAEHPNEWTRLAARWDPSGDLTKRFEDYLDGDDKNHIGNDNKPTQQQPTTTTTRTTTMTTTTTSIPSIVNRFGPLDEEEQPSSSEVKPTIRSIASSSSAMTDAVQPVTRYDRPATRSPTTATFKPITFSQRPATKATTTKKPYYPPPPRPIVDLTPIYAGTMGLIDHFGNKIIKTTELVTDLLKTTVRVVVGEPPS